MPSPWGAELATEVYRRYGADLPGLRRLDPLLPRIGKSYAGEERRLLYLMTRLAAPEVIFELSPKRGWSTAHMALALEDANRGRILSFELDPVLAELTRRTLRSVGLAHRGRVVAGDVRETLPREYEALRRAGALSGIAFLFIDSEHSAPFARWYLENLFPLVERGGLIHVHGIEASPERVARGERVEPAPSGEEHLLARFLTREAARYQWWSVAEAVQDPAYLAGVRPHGGGDLSIPPGGLPPHPADQAAGRERNPTLWIRKTGAQEMSIYPGVPFEPIRRGRLGDLRYAVRGLLAPVYAPLREARRLRKLGRHAAGVPEGAASGAS
jgi:predicted O-methyltransferase YrrM